MLSLDYLEDKIYTNNIVKMYQELNTELINDIISKLKDVGDISSYTRKQMENISKIRWQRHVYKCYKENKWFVI